ncbi:MAG TPA: TolC family protein, partial [bacterium]|nr:TolC family protein [bacterium]
EISKQLITGGQIDLRYEDQRMENRLFRPDPEYYSGLNLLLTQPLLDGFGRNSSLYRVRLSKKNREISSRVFEQTLLNVAYEVEAAYWDLVLAIRLVDIQKQNLDLAQSLLSRNTERFDVGMLPSYEILENQSHVASRRENLLSVVNALEDANDRLATLMNLLDSPAGGFSFLPLDDVVCEAFEPSASDSLAVAFERRPDLKQASLAIERSDLRLRYVRNQSLPSLNLITGLGLHGFDHAYSAAHDDLRDDNTYDWRIGVVFEVPFGSRESRYQHRKAVLLRQQAADQMRSLQQRVLTDIREAVRQIQTDQERIPAAMLAREFAQQRMQVEESLFDQGMSTTHDLLEYQQTLALAQLDELRAQVDLRKAFSKLRFLEGRLLDEFGFEFVEPDIWEE